jgi:hypothetical protein
LDDGSVYSVDPGDQSTVSSWSQGDSVSVSDSQDAIFNTSAGESVSVTSVGDSSDANAYAGSGSSIAAKSDDGSIIVLDDGSIGSSPRTTARHPRRGSTRRPSPSTTRVPLTSSSTQTTKKPSTRTTSGRNERREQPGGLGGPHRRLASLGVDRDGLSDTVSSSSGSLSEPACGWLPVGREIVDEQLGAGCGVTAVRGGDRRRIHRTSGGRETGISARENGASSRPLTVTPATVIRPRRAG